MPNTLSFQGEFSQELILFLPFINYLSSIGRMNDIVLEIQHGMECYYKHIKCVKIRKNVRRYHMNSYDSPDWLPCCSEFENTKHPHMLYIDHRELFQQSAKLLQLPNSKPLLIIHNKHNIEWDTGRPVNYINADTLDHLFSRFEREYNVVYVRHGMNKLPNDYSHDVNTMIATDEDRQVLAKHPSVVSFDDLWLEHKHMMSYNEFKGSLYALCYKYISVQGGGAHQVACYSGSDLHILHVMGSETDFAYTEGFYTYAADPPCSLHIYNSNDELLNCLL